MIDLTVEIRIAGKILVERRLLYSRLNRNFAQRGRLVTVLCEQVLCSVENAIGRAATILNDSACLARLVQAVPFRYSHAGLSAA